MERIGFTTLRFHVQNEYVIGAYVAVVGTWSPWGKYGVILTMKQKESLKNIAPFPN